MHYAQLIIGFRSQARSPLRSPFSFAFPQPLTSLVVVYQENTCDTRVTHAHRFILISLNPFSPF